MDLPEPRVAAIMLKCVCASSLRDCILTVTRWLKQTGLDTPSMAHLKRIRRVDDKMSMILTLTRDHPEPPVFPENVELPPPYILAVPKTAALTMASLKIKSSLWPTIYAPRKKYEPEPWTRGKVRWAFEAMQQVVEQARSASEKGEVMPIPFSFWHTSH